MGYIKRTGSTHGRRLSRQAVVGVLVTESTGPAARHQVTSMMTAGLSFAATECEAALVVHHVPHIGGMELLHPDQGPPLLRSGMVHGLVLMHRFEPEVVNRLAERLPCATLAHFVPTAKADNIDSDHAHSFALLTDHLYSLGHRKMGFINRRAQSAITRARFSSFIQSLRRLDIPWDMDQELFYPVDGTDAECDLQISKLVSLIKGGIRAWLCDSDGTAYRIVRKLIDCGIKVPQDVSVTGYDALEPQYGCPQICTVRVPFIDMGSTALRRLLLRIEHPSSLPQQIMLRCELVAGASTGPAR